MQLFLFLVNKPKSPPKLKPVKFKFSNSKIRQLTGEIFQKGELVYLYTIWERWACVVSEGSQKHSKKAPDRVWANSGRWPLKNTAKHFLTEHGKRSLLWTSHVHFFVEVEFYTFFVKTQDWIKIICREQHFTISVQWWKQVTCSEQVGSNVHLCEEHGFGCFFSWLADV